MIFVSFKEPVLVQTDGSGLWNSHAADVKVTGMTVNPNSRSLIVYFDKATWDRDAHGLIYSDEGFQGDLESILEKMGLPRNEIEYSEHGAQGEDFVDFDVSEAFLDAWERLGPPGYSAKYDEVEVCLDNDLRGTVEESTGDMTKSKLS